MRKTNTSRWHRIFKTINPLLSVSALLLAGPAWAQTADYSRQLTHEKGHWVYTVNARAPHLYMISRDLYGNEKSWQDIAKWNHLTAPYTVNPGQNLVLEKAPTLNNKQSDDVLLNQYAHLQRWETWKGILALHSVVVVPAPGPMPASVTADQTAAKSAAAVAVAAPKNASLAPAQNSAPAPAVAPAALPAPTPSTQTLAAAEPEEKAEFSAPVSEASIKQEEKTKERRWEFTTAAAASMFRLDSNYSSSGIHNTLYSQVDYGVEAEAQYRLDEKRHVFLGFAVEHMDIQPTGNSAEVDGDSQNLWHFAAGFEQELTSRWALAGSFIFEQDPFSRPTPGGTSVDLIYIPQIALGAHFKAYEKGRFEAELQGQGLVLLPRTQDSYDLKTGYGGSLGLQLQNKFEKNALTYGLAYRYLRQDSTLATSSQQGGFANVGLIW